MYMEEYIAQQAVEQTGFGKFNLKITGVCALMYFNCAFCITSVGFVVPTASCDFQMTTIDKGRINAAPMLGMVVGSCLWGYIADLKGRRRSLLISLVLQLTVDILSSVVPNYWVFVFLKFLSGVGATGQLTIIFPYLGEFQPARYRHVLLSWMEFSWALGVILIALFAWVIIPLDFAFRIPMFFFSSWNLFVLLSATPALICLLWLLTLPETPKYLAENGKCDSLLKVLTRMYVENTGNSAEEFKEKLLKCGVPSISGLVSQEEAIKTDELSKEKRSMSLTKKQKLKEMLASSKIQMKRLVRRPYLKRLFVCGSIMFCMTSTYYSLMTWFPELFQRFAAFEAKHPGEFASVCTVSKKEVNLNNTQIEDVNPFGCGKEIHETVYKHSAWLGVACLPFAIILPLTVNRVGYRVYMMFTAIISCAVTIAFFFVKTSTQNLVLSCIFEAFTSLNISVMFCIIVELFPTNLRVMASAVVLLIGRCGSLFGNMIFGYLIDDYCSILIIVMASQLFFASVMSFATPGNEKMKKMQEASSHDVEIQSKPRCSVINPL